MTVKLQVETKITKYVDWHGDNGLQKVCADFLKCDEFDILECANDSSLSVEVRRDGLDDYEKEEVEGVISCKAVVDYQLEMLMNHLCNEGVIDPGSYVIDVSW